MDRELIDRVWKYCLPKEFKEEVKEIYLNAVEHHPCGYNHKTDLMKYLFGKHNLTSDAEGEDMLICEKSKVQRAYNTSREIVNAENPDSLMYSMHTQIMCVLENIFGSKCLPEEDAHEDNFATKKPQPAEPKFKIGDKVRVKFNAKELHSNPDPSKNIYYWQTARDKYLGKVFKITDIWKSGTITLNTAEVMFWEPFDLEPYTEPKDDKHFDNILKDSFHGHDRLHIAAMIAQGIMANSNPQIVDMNVERVVDLAILTADTLIAKCEKGGELMDVRPVDELEPETVDYWTATNPDGRQFTYRSKPVRYQWVNQWIWDPSTRGYYIGEEATKVLIDVLGLPKLTWDDEPYKFTILKPKRDDQD